jgi:hypothetical protein
MYVTQAAQFSTYAASMRDKVPPKTTIRVKIGDTNAADVRILPAGGDNGTVPDGSKASDMMGYCSPYWVSAYDWSRVISFFETGPSASGESATPAAAGADSDEYKELPADQLAMHERGALRNGELMIESGWTDYGSPFHTNLHDDALFEGLDKAGRVVFSAPGEVLSVRGSSDRSSDRSIEMHAPISASVQRDLAAIRLTYEGMTAVRYGLPPGPIVASVVATDPGHVKLSFDGRHFDYVLVCNQGHHDCQRAYGDGTERSHDVVEFSDRTLCLTFTNGIKSVAWEVPSDVQGR